MRGDKQVLEFLNEQLSAELTAINQYFLHAKMQENFGWVKLARHTRAESIDEMRHAEILTDRILFLDGLPNYQRLFPLRIGQSITQMLESDMAVEVEAVDRLRRGSEYMRSISDITSAKLFEEILADEEGHIDYLETQLRLVETLGEAAAPLSLDAARLKAVGGRVRHEDYPGLSHEGIVMALSKPFRGKGPVLDHAVAFLHREMPPPR